MTGSGWCECGVGFFSLHFLVWPVLISVVTAQLHFDLLPLISDEWWELKWACFISCCLHPPPPLLFFPPPVWFDLCVFAWPPHWACVFVCLCPQKGLKNVFDEAILAALEPPEPKKKRKCVLLWEVAPLFRAHTHTRHTRIHLRHTHTPTHSPHPFPLLC